jgi:hypothetical protein
MAEPNPLTNAATVVHGEWSMCVQAGVRCDRTLTGDSPCATAISIGAPMWVETHTFEAPTLAHRSYAVVTCEQCRLLEVAHEWAESGDVPPHAIHRSNRRGLAGHHMLTPDQYERAATAAKTMLRANPPAAHDVPPPPASETPSEPLIYRESRKTRAERRQDRRALAG